MTKMGNSVIYSLIDQKNVIIPLNTFNPIYATQPIVNIVD